MRILFKQEAMCIFFNYVNSNAGGIMLELCESISQCQRTLKLMSLQIKSKQHFRSVHLLKTLKEKNPFKLKARQREWKKRQR